MDKKKLLRSRLRHHLHPLHILCRLCDATGMEERKAGKLLIYYEYYVWRWLKKLIEMLPKGKGV